MKNLKISFLIILQRQRLLEKAPLRMVYYYTSLGGSQVCLSSSDLTRNAKAKGIPAVVRDQTQFILKASFPMEKRL